MILEGDKSVITALKEKKRLMEAGESHKHIRPLLFIDGGLMKGAYGAGALLALEEAGFTDTFHTVVGVSSGAPSAAYFVSSDVRRSASIFYEECCTKTFLNVWRLWNQVNTGYLMDVFKHDPTKQLDVSKVLAAPMRLFIGVAEFATGKPVLVEPKQQEELFFAVHASILMPNVSTHKVELDAVRYADGGFTDPHVLREAIDTIDATHLLYITNQDHGSASIPLLERFLNSTFYRRRMSRLLRKAAHSRRLARLAVLEHMADHYPNPHLVVWGDGSIKSMERDSTKVRAVVERSHRWWRELLSGHKSTQVDR